MISGHNIGIMVIQEKKKQSPFNGDGKAKKILRQTYFFTDSGLGIIR